MQTDFEKTKPTDNFEVNFINHWLLLRFGTDPMRRQFFRLVWSDSLAERRTGEHEVWNGSIYLRTEDGSYQTEKYGYIKERWILECLVYLPNKEVLGSEIGNYEPVWVFWDRQGGYKQPNLKAVKFILNCMFEGQPMSKKDWERLDKKKQEETLRICEDILGEVNTPIGLALSTGEAVGYGRK